MAQSLLTIEPTMKHRLLVCRHAPYETVRTLLMLGGTFSLMFTFVYLLSLPSRDKSYSFTQFCFIIISIICFGAFVRAIALLGPARIWVKDGYIEVEEAGCNNIHLKPEKILSLNVYPHPSGDQIVVFRIKGQRFRTPVGFVIENGNDSDQMIDCICQSLGLDRNQYVTWQ